MRNSESRFLAAAAAAGVLLSTWAASAQEAPATGSDHEQVVGHLGVGLLGTRTVDVPDAGGLQTVGVPIVGVRYWLNPQMGIDAGVGARAESFSGETDGDGYALPSSMVFAVHAGVPLALASSGHFSFQVVPEANFAMGSWSDNQDPETEGGLLQLDLGARAGAEIQFGFIDIPQLSLQGGVGLHYTMSRTSMDDGTVETKNTTHRLSTGAHGDPWDMFTGNLAALYYF